MRGAERYARAPDDTCGRRATCRAPDDRARTPTDHASLGAGRHARMPDDIRRHRTTCALPSHMRRRPGTCDVAGQHSQAPSDMHRPGRHARRRTTCAHAQRHARAPDGILGRPAICAGVARHARASGGSEHQGWARDGDPGPESTHGTWGCPQGGWFAGSACGRVGGVVGPEGHPRRSNSARRGTRAGSPRAECAGSLGLRRGGPTPPPSLPLPPSPPPPPSPRPSGPSRRSR